MTIIYTSIQTTLKSPSLAERVLHSATFQFILSILQLLSHIVTIIGIAVVVVSILTYFRQLQHRQEDIDFRKKERSK